MDGSVHVIGLDHIVVMSADVERALGFYMGTLGLTGVRVDEWRRGEAPFPSVRIDATTIIDLFPGQRSGENIAHLCLTIAPIDLDQLAGGAAFDVVDGPIDALFGAQGYARSLYVRDPDGNTIELRSYNS